MFAPPFPVPMQGEFSLIRDRLYSSAEARSRKGLSALPSPPSAADASTYMSRGPAKPQKSGLPLILPSPGQRSSVSRHENVTTGWESCPAMSKEPGPFPQTIQLVMIGEEAVSQYTPPPKSDAAFPEIVQFVMVGDEFSPHATPPPPDPRSPPTVLAEIVQFVKIGEPAQYTPPPLTEVSGERHAATEFREIVQFVRVVDAPQEIPPPECIAEFPEIAQFVRVGDELSAQYTPPPQYARLPEIMQFVRTGKDPPAQLTPPPKLHQSLPEILQSAKVGEEPLL